jgi:hypothetical protein
MRVLYLIESAGVYGAEKMFSSSGTKEPGLFGVMEPVLVLGTGMLWVLSLRGFGAVGNLGPR